MKKIEVIKKPEAKTRKPDASTAVAAERLRSAKRSPQSAVDQQVSEIERTFCAHWEW